MKFLHTADIHLQNKEHLEVLKIIVKAANQNSCGWILISGNIFDKENSNLLVEQSLPQILQEFKGEIFIIAGNHDAGILSKRKSLSSNSTVFNTDKPYIKYDVDGIEIIAVPFKEEISFKDIGEIECGLENSILMTHGCFYTQDFFYDDENRQYFPIFEEDLRDKFHYVALGHYHKLIKKELGKTIVINPGSPRITRSSDIGERMVSIVDTKTWKIELLPLPVPYNRRIDLNINVFDDLNNIENKIQTFMSQIEDRRFAVLTVVLSGTLSTLIEINELHQLIQSKAGKDCFIDSNNLRLIDDNLLSNSFIQSLMEELEKNSNDKAEQEKIKLFALERLNAILQ